MADRRNDVHGAGQRLCDALTTGYDVAPLRMIVLARRPSDAGASANAGKGEA